MRSPDTISELPLNFNRRIVATILTDGVYSCPANLDTPCLAYLDLEHINLNLKHVILSHQAYNVSSKATRRRFHFPMRCHRPTQRRHIKPEQEREDPYMMAVLIALAQMQKSRLVEDGRAAAGEDRTISVYLLALTTDTQSFYFYAARIPFAFLHGLDYPSRYFPAVPLTFPAIVSPLKPEDEAVRVLGRALAGIRSEYAGHAA